MSSIFCYCTALFKTNNMCVRASKWPVWETNLFVPLEIVLVFQSQRIKWSWNHKWYFVTQIGVFMKSYYVLILIFRNINKVTKSDCYRAFVFLTLFGQFFLLWHLLVCPSPYKIDISTSLLHGRDCKKGVREGFTKRHFLKFKILFIKSCPNELKFKHNGLNFDYIISILS